MIYSYWFADLEDLYFGWIQEHLERWVLEVVLLWVLSCVDRTVMCISYMEMDHWVTALLSLILIPVTR